MWFVVFVVPIVEDVLFAGDVFEDFVEVFGESVVVEVGGIRHDGKRFVFGVVGK